MLLSYGVANAQNGSKHEEIKTYVIHLAGKYNDGVAPKFVSNIDSVEKIIKKSGVNYRVDFDVFLGEIAPGKQTTGSSQSISNFKPKKFIYYTYTQSGNMVEITVLSGHNSW